MTAIYAEKLHHLFPSSGAKSYGSNESYKKASQVNQKIKPTSIASVCKLHDDNCFIGVEQEIEYANHFLLEQFCGAYDSTGIEKFYKFHKNIDPELAVNYIIFNKFWHIKSDGSLRGSSSRELVLRHPLTGASLRLALKSMETLLTQLNKHGEPVLFSERASTHLHFNMLDVKIIHFFAFIIFYTLYEGMFFNFAGHNRRCNNYCVPIQDSLKFIKLLSTFWQHFHGEYSTLGDLAGVLSAWGKYSALNIGKNKHVGGTVEARHLTSTSDINRIVLWANLFLHIRSYVLFNIQTPEDLTKELLKVGEDPTGFTKQLFGDDYDVVTSYLQLDELEKGITTANEILFLDDNYSWAIPKMFK